MNIHRMFKILSDHGLRAAFLQVNGESLLGAEPATATWDAAAVPQSVRTLLRDYLPKENFEFLFGAADRDSGPGPS